MRKLLIIPLIILMSCGRIGINDFNNIVIIDSHCGFHGLTKSYYTVLDINTKEISVIEVREEYCNVYQIGDTIIK